MNRTLAITLGGFWTIGLVLLGVWAWQRADAIARLAPWNRPALGLWAVRCMGAALISCGEAILLAMVVDRIYRPDGVTGAVRLSALLIGMGCFVASIALGFAGR